MFPKDELDIIALAREVLPEFLRVAMALSIQRASPILGTVGAESLIAYVNLENPTRQDQSFQVQLQEISVLLGDLYGFQTHAQSRHSVLRELSKAVKTLGPDTPAEKRLKRNLIVWDKHHADARKHHADARKHHADARKNHNDAAISNNALVQLHEAFATLNKPFLELEETVKGKPPPDPDDYPSSVNSRLYQTLKENLKCRCIQSCPSPDSHRYTRLYLTPQDYMREQDVRFDLLFSGDVLLTYKRFHWQQVRLLLPSKESRPKGKVSFIGDLPPLHNSPVTEDNLLEAEDFSHWLDEYHGAIWMRAKIKNGKIFKILDADDYGEPLEPCESISLMDVLLNYRLTGKMKLVLAYILAHSVWRYYNSDWMKARWSTDSIHFLKIKAPDMSGTRIYACNPCFAVQFQAPNDEVTEFYNGVVAHKYPRLLALGNLLLDIGCQRLPLSRTSLSTDNLDQQINDDCALSMNTLRRDDNWPYLGTMRDTSVRTKYKEITQACFDKNLFLPCMTAASAMISIQKEPQSIQDAEERRGILYKRVVAPLAELLEGLGWKDALKKIEPMEEHSPRGALGSPSSITEVGYTDNNFARPDFRESSSSTSYQSRSRDWLQQIQNEYRPILERHSKQSSSEHYPRIRIAVLDTGYDPQAEFFVNRDRKIRLRGWKDWVAQSETPKDDDGHGSRVLSLLMKVAPMADIYVARIANNSSGLEHSSQFIANAISWASADCNADIICMCFGFVDEQVVAGQKPLRKAIHLADVHRNERILFFAAAGNEGANLQKVMFPARHELVIPVYGTDASGVFLEDLNPRIKPDGPAIFGTLAKDAPCSGLSEEGEVCVTGTSFATAIAAGLAGMILEYIQILANKTEDNNKGQHYWKARLSTRRGMLAMFQQIAEQPPDRHYYLHPIHFFGQNEDVREARIVIAADNAG